MTLAVHPEVLLKLRHFCRVLQVGDVGDYIGHGQHAILRDEARRRARPENPVGYAVVVARRAMVDRWRSEREDRRRTRDHALERAWGGPGRDERLDLRAMLASLPAWEAMAVDALYGLGFTEKEIAAATGRPHHEVHERIRQAVAQLRRRYPSYVEAAPRRKHRATRA